MKFDGLDNLALGKTARQSSTSDNFSLDDASRALADDGKQDFAFHTDIEDTPWWQVDLEDVYPIYYIVIGNRRKTCQERAITLKIEISLDGKAWQLVHAGLISWDDDLVWPFGGLISARFVRLSLREKTYFHLAKVDIWGVRKSGLKPRPQLSDPFSLWTETKPEVLQELNAILSTPVNPVKMIIDLGDFHPIWALELAAPPKTGLEEFKDLKIEYSIDGRDWRIIHEGMLFLTGRIYYPLQGEIMARFIKISRSLTAGKHLGLRDILRSLRYRLLHRRSWPLVKVFTRRQPDIQVRALRTDGWGGRLMALLNAMYMAKLLGCDYKFVWPARDHAAGVVNSLVSINDAHELFDADFIQDHMLGRPDNASRLHGASNLCRRHLIRLDKQDRPGIIHSTYRDPVGFYHPRLEPPDSCFKSLFESLPFSPAFQEFFTMVRQVELPPNYVAVHLRSGDVVFSDLRNEILHLQHKTVPLPLAKLALEKLCGENRPVVLFGQDVNALAYLASCYKVSLVTDYLPSKTLTRPQNDLFEFILISRASCIYSCRMSFYARCADLIGGKSKLIDLHEMFSPKEKTRYLKADLAKNAICYHPFHNSFAYLYLYHLNHLTADQEELVFYLKQAQNYDPENEVINILRATEYFKHHNEKAGEELLENWLKLTFDLNQQTIQYESNHFLNPERAGRYLGFHLRNYLQPLLAAAKAGYPNAAAVMSIMYGLDLLRNKEKTMSEALFWQGIALEAKSTQRRSAENSDIARIVTDA